MPWITGALIGGTALYNILDASKRRKAAKKGLAELARQNYQYASLRDAEGAVREGFSKEERAAFMGQKAAAEAQNYQRAIQMNPNLGSAIQSGINYSSVGSLLDFASRDAAMRRQRQQQWLQRSDLETQRKLREKEMKEQQYGAAYSEASADISNAIGSLAAGAASMYGSYQGESGGKGGGPFSFGKGGKKGGGGTSNTNVGSGSFYKPGSIYDKPLFQND